MTDEELWAEVAADLGKATEKSGGDRTSPAAQPAAEYKTTTATTPKEQRKEESEKFIGAMRSDLQTSRGEAALGGAVRGATLGILPYGQAEGEQLGEDVYRLAHGQALTANRDVEREVLQREVAKEREVARDYPWTYAGAEMVGSLAPSLLIPGGRVAGVTKLGVPVAERQGIRYAATRGLASPEANIVAQNAISGATTTGSTNPKELAAGAAGGVLAGKAVGSVAEKTIGKIIKGSTGREANNIVRDILRNEKTDVSVSATARKRFYEKGSAAVDEVRADPELRAAVRAGDAELAGRLAQGKLEVISQPRNGLYSELDSVSMLSLGEIDKAIRKAERVATGAKKDALEAMRKRLNTDWTQRWENTGMLVRRAPEEAERGLVGYAVRGRGVREWLTDAQNQADMVIGGLEEGPRKKVKTALEDVAHDVWHAHLARVERKNPEVVKAIRQYDKRASGLLAVEEVMKQRAQKDYEGSLGFAKKAERTLEGLAAAGAAAGVAAGNLYPLAGLAFWGAVKKSPQAGRAINDMVIAPIQRAVMDGRPWAEIAAAASEKGIPQSIARGAYDAGVKMLEESRRKARGGSGYGTSTVPQ